MMELFLHWTQVSGWRVVLILILWLVAYYATNRFGQQFISLVLTKERAVLRQRHQTLSIHEQQRVETISSVMSKLIRACVVLIFGSMLLTEIGIPVAPVFAGAGIVGITIGFGAQSVIKDVLAGLFIVLENQYAKGDRIKIGEVIGVVEDVSLRLTIVRDDADTAHYIPNGSIQLISNYSKHSGSKYNNSKQNSQLKV